MLARLHLGMRKIPYGIRIIRKIHQFQNEIGSSVIIQGSYNTGNIGDLAIGTSIQNELKKMGFRSHLCGFISTRHMPEILNYDYHIVGGGGVIRDYPEGYLEGRLSPIGTTKKGSILLGVGFNGLRTERGKKLIKKLDECKLITVRDEKSKRNLQPFIDKKVEVSACPAFLMKPKKRKIKEKTLGISLHDFYGTSYGWGDYAYYPEKIDMKMKQKQYFNYLNQTLKPNLKIIAKEYKIVFIPFTLQDITFAREHLNNIDMKILNLKTPRQTLNTICGLDKMICMRYHSIIFSIIAEKPMFIISYQNKTRELTKKLKNVSYVDFLNPNIIDADFTIDKRDVIKLKKEMIKSSKKNFEKLEKVLQK